MSTTLKEKIAADYMTALREKDSVTKNLLSIVKGAILNIEKERKIDKLPDADIISILNKTAKNLREVISINGDEESTLQLAIVEKLLPAPMNRDEIEKKVKLLISTGINNMGLIMKEFANDPVDRKIVQELIKENL